RCRRPASRAHPGGRLLDRPAIPRARARRRGARPRSRGHHSPGLAAGPLARLEHTAPNRENQCLLIGAALVASALQGDPGIGPGAREGVEMRNVRRIMERVWRRGRKTKVVLLGAAVAGLAAGVAYAEQVQVGNLIV